MSLWYFLALTSGPTTFGSALGAVLILRRNGAHASLVVGTIAALVLGVLAASAPLWLRARAERAFPTATESPTALVLWLLYGGVVLWIFVAATLAHFAIGALFAVL